MPLIQLHQRQPNSHDPKCKYAFLCLMAGMISVQTGLAKESVDSPTLIRSQLVELHYQLKGGSSCAQVELWFTRDQGITWHRYGMDRDSVSPLVFKAPAEGLYGFKLIAQDGDISSSQPPKPYELPQRWVFVDYTPPLVQWDDVEPADDFVKNRKVHLRWTAYDRHMPNRAVSLSYQSSLDQTWHVIDEALPNVGRYDWVVPEKVSGQITFKITIRDRGGHVVERLYGPEPIQRWIKTSVVPTAMVKDEKTGSTVTTRPADERPSTKKADLNKIFSSDTYKKAEALYSQGCWYLDRGQYALAVERFKEALKLHPQMPTVLKSMAKAHYYMEDFPKALEFYKQVLAQKELDPEALRGAAEVYATQKRYPQSYELLSKLLAVDETNTETWLDLGDVFYQMGDLNRARYHWQKAATLDESAIAVVKKARGRLNRFTSLRSSLTTANAKP